MSASGQGEMIDGVRVLNPAKVPGIVYLIPCGKSPHGVDVSPDGKYVIGSGKLQGVTTAFNFEKIQTAIKQSKMKVQAAIQGDTVRITGAKRDDLQLAMQLIKKTVPDAPLSFNNFRD